MKNNRFATDSKSYDSYAEENQRECGIGGRWWEVNEIASRKTVEISFAEQL